MHTSRIANHHLVGVLRFVDWSVLSAPVLAVYSSARFFYPSGDLSRAAVAFFFLSLCFFVFLFFFFLGSMLIDIGRSGAAQDLWLGPPPGSAISASGGGGGSAELLPNTQQKKKKEKEIHIQEEKSMKEREEKRSDGGR